MRLSTVAKYIVLLMLIPSIFVFAYPGKISVISVLCSYPLIIIFTLFIPSFKKKSFEGKRYVYLFLVLNFIIIFRGFVDAKSAEDWKVLLSHILPIYTLCTFFIFLGLKDELVKILFSSFFKYGILFSSILLFSSESLGMLGFPHNVSPICLLIIFSPYLRYKFRMIIFIVAFISFISHISMRANLLNIVIAYLISFTYYFRRIKLVLPNIKIVRKFLLLSPLILIVLGLSGIFNVFQIGEVIGEFNIESKEGSKDDLVVDSRTGIYLDVILELNKEKAFLWGLGGSGKTDTYLTEKEWSNFDEIYKEGRRATESGMLNYAQYGGAIGICIYFLLFVKSSYLSIYKSNNWLFVMIGLWLLFKGLFAFIEDRLYLNLNFLFLMLTIGMSFNESLRQMSNSEIKVFVRSIFEKKVVQ